MKIVVLDAETLGFETAGWDAVAEMGELVLRPNTSHSAEAVLAAAAGAEVVLTNKVPLRKEVLMQLEHLKLISVLATGYNIIDVVSVEPMRPENPRLDAANCIITPHLAWASEPSRRRLLAVSEQNIQAFTSGHLQNVII